MGDRVTCSRCAQLQTENERLRAQVRQLEERIRQMKRVIKISFDSAVGIEHGAAGKMNKGGLPRATWSYHKGLKAAAGLLKEKIAEALFA